MLEAIRNNTNSIFVKALLVLIVGSFALWGIGDMFRGGGQQDVAKVGDDMITDTQLSMALQDDISRFQQMFGGQIPDIFRQTLEQQVLERLINQHLLEQEAARLGIHVPVTHILERIGNDALFQEDGVFSKDRFAEVLRFNGMTEADYVHTVQQQIATGELIDLFTNQPFALDAQARLIHHYQNEARTFSYITIGTQDIPPIQDPSETDLIAYYDTHDELFSAPEYRRFKLITLSRMDVINNLDISDESMRAYYDDNQDLYTLPERARIEQIILPDVATAMEVRAELMDNATLADIHAKQATVPATWTDLGEVSAGDLPAGAQEVIDATAVGNVSMPSESAFGVHLYRVAERFPATIKPFEDVKDTIQQDVITNQLDQMMYDMSVVLEDAFAAGSTLEEAANASELTIQTIGMIDAEGLQPDGTALPLPFDEPEFLEYAFSLEQGDEPELRLSQNRTYYALSLESVTPSRSRALDEVRGTVIQSWKKAETERLLLEQAQDIASQAASGIALGTIAANWELANPTRTTVTRNTANASEGEDADDNIKQSIAPAIFTLAPEETTNAVMTEGGGYVIARLHEITPAEEPDDAAIQSIVSDLLPQYHRELLDLYTRHLRSRYGVEIYRSYNQQPAASLADMPL